MQHAFGFGGEWNICALGYELGFQARDIVFADDIRARRGNPDLAFDIDHGVGIELFTIGIIGDVFAGVFKFDQAANIDALGIVNRSTRIACRDQHRTLFAEKARRVFADRAEALNDHARAFESRSRNT